MLSCRSSNFFYFSAFSTRLECKTCLLNMFGYLPLGLLIGAFGTLIGAGGGFILVPILLLIIRRKRQS